MINSEELAGGVGVGFTGHIHGFNADAEARLDSMMMQVGRWVEKEAGYLMGHIKMSVTVDGKAPLRRISDISSGLRQPKAYHTQGRTCRCFLCRISGISPLAWVLEQVCRIRGRTCR